MVNHKSRIFVMPFEDLIKWKPKSENYGYCLEATKLENEINQLEKKGWSGLSQKNS